ncbi:KEOPS complex subunit Cgi121 [Saliphagus infecundisoli]|uniref:KEOPS complex subunit Cgi121 n=1 Tax=Saliphagus infecundisoli TaxID=1849069 RepID=A0ABD5QA51_9EURY|nr:KEOPS complex subunit Cgi121 [Saliphagus infecundisoli]
MELLPCRLSIDDLDRFVARLGEIGDTHGATIQAFDARYVAGEAHLRRAVELADRAIARKEAIARDRAVEILLYAAGRRQIDRALEMGVGEGECDAVVLIDGGDEVGALADLRGLDAFVGDREAMGGDEATIERFFEITAAERAATDAVFEDLVRERVALLVVEK